MEMLAGSGKCLCGLQAVRWEGACLVVQMEGGMLWCCTRAGATEERSCCGMQVWGSRYCSTVQASVGGGRSVTWAWLGGLAYASEFRALCVCVCICVCKIGPRPCFVAYYFWQNIVLRPPFPLCSERRGFIKLALSLPKGRKAILSQLSLKLFTTFYSVLWLTLVWCCVCLSTACWPFYRSALGQRWEKQT